MIFKGLQSVLSIIMALALLAGGFTIFQWELGSSLEVIFDKILLEKLYNNNELAAVGVKSSATYSLPPYTKVGFHKVECMDGELGSVIYVYNYEPYNSVRNKLNFVSAIIDNAELLLSYGIGTETDLANLQKLKSAEWWYEHIGGAINFIKAHITGNTERVKGGFAYYTPIEIIDKGTQRDSGVIEPTATFGHLQKTSTFKIDMWRAFDTTQNRYIVYWNITPIYH